MGILAGASRRRLVTSSPSFYLNQSVSDPFRRKGFRPLPTILHLFLRQVHKSASSSARRRNITIGCRGLVLAPAHLSSPIKQPIHPLSELLWTLLNIRTPSWLPSMRILLETFVCSQSKNGIKNFGRPWKSLVLELV